MVNFSKFCCQTSANETSVDKVDAFSQTENNATIENLFSQTNFLVDYIVENQCPCVKGSVSEDDVIVEITQQVNELLENTSKIIERAKSSIKNGENKEFKDLPNDAGQESGDFKFAIGDDGTSDNHVFETEILPETTLIKVGENKKFEDLPNDARQGSGDFKCAIGNEFKDYGRASDDHVFEEKLFPKTTLHNVDEKKEFGNLPNYVRQESGDFKCATGNEFKDDDGASDNHAVFEAKILPETSLLKVSKNKEFEVFPNESGDFKCAIGNEFENCDGASDDHVIEAKIFPVLTAPEEIKVPCQNKYDCAARLLYNSFLKISKDAKYERLNSRSGENVASVYGSGNENTITSNERSTFALAEEQKNGDVQETIGVFLLEVIDIASEIGRIKKKLKDPSPILMFPERGSGYVPNEFDKCFEKIVDFASKTDYKFKNFPQFNIQKDDKNIPRNLERGDYVS